MKWTPVDAGSFARRTAYNMATKQVHGVPRLPPQKRPTLELGNRRTRRRAHGSTVLRDTPSNHSLYRARALCNRLMKQCLTSIISTGLKPRQCRFRCQAAGCCGALRRSPFLQCSEVAMPLESLKFPFPPIQSRTVCKPFRVCE